MAEELKLLIAGELVGGDSSMNVIDPSTGSPFTTAPRASSRQLGLAVASAKAAQPAWAALALSARRERLIALADAIQKNSAELARTLVREQGKPLAEAIVELAFTEGLVRYFAAIDLPVDVLQDDESLRIEVHRKALGVVCGITPWNFPLFLAAIKFAPALLLGNSFILKPAPTTPVSSLMLARLAQPLLPAGVFSVITDLNDLGAELTAHPDVAKIAFTGSTATGKKVMQAAAPGLKRITLELGGNDASIVLDDVDVSVVAPKILAAAFANAGQVCIAAKRVYAHRNIYDALCNELARLADAMVVGNGLQADTQMGPVQNAVQFEKTKSLIESARRDGRIIAGGSVGDGKGYFIRPTIVRDIDDGATLVDEEQFAPILPIVKFDDVDEVVSRVNRSIHGLGGSVWSSDHDRAYVIARQIDSGTSPATNARRSISSTSASRACCRRTIGSGPIRSSSSANGARPGFRACPRSISSSSKRREPTPTRAPARTARVPMAVARPARSIRAAATAPMAFASIRISRIAICFRIASRPAIA